jgi:WD40 repeat protein
MAQKDPNSMAIIRGCTIFLLMAFLLLLIGGAIMLYPYFRKSTALEGMKMIVCQPIGGSSDLRFSQDSKSLYIATATNVLQYDLNGNLKNRIDLRGEVIAFTLNDDGTELGCLLQRKGKISFAEIDSEKLELLAEKELLTDSVKTMKPILRSVVIWSESNKSWITYCGFDAGSSPYQTLMLGWLATWCHRTLDKEAELLGEDYIRADWFSNVYPIPGIDSLVVLDAGHRFTIWDYKKDSVISRSYRSGEIGYRKYFSGPDPGTYATLDEKRITVFQHETNEILFRTLEHPPLPDEDRMRHNLGTIVDMTYTSNRALYARQGGPMLFEYPVFQLLVVFDFESMKIVALEKSKNAHYITKAVMSPNGKYVATIGNWKGNWRGLTDSINIYELTE